MDTCLRTCLWRDISCFGRLSRTGSRVMCLRRERGHVMVQQAGRAVAHTSCASSRAFREENTVTALVQWCATARVRPPFRWHGCCERSKGEHHSHRTEPVREQSGKRRRHCTRRSFEGNGFEFTMSVQGTCLLLANRSLHIAVGVVRLF